jgi:hypothetical protein
MDRSAAWLRVLDLKAIYLTRIGDRPLTPSLESRIHEAAMLTVSSRDRSRPLSEGRAWRAHGRGCKAERDAGAAVAILTEALDGAGLPLEGWSGRIRRRGAVASRYTRRAPELWLPTKS